MAKGASFERQVAKHLSLWWTAGRHDDTIWRTSQSGGRATTRRRKGKRTSGQAGDLCSTDPASRGLFRLFAFELKVGYHQVTINDLIDRPHTAAFQKDGWDGWLEQAHAAARESGALWWCIIHHRNRAAGGKRTMVYFDPGILQSPFAKRLPKFCVRVGNVLVGFRFMDVFGHMGPNEEFPPSKLRRVMKAFAVQLKFRRNGNGRQRESVRDPARRKGAVPGQRLVE